VQFGVPHGSNLGTILFSINVIDIFNNFNILPVLFIDDTCLIVEASSIDELNYSFNTQVEKARIWTNSNKLIINADKEFAQQYTEAAVQGKVHESRMKYNKDRIFDDVSKSKQTEGTNLVLFPDIENSMYKQQRLSWPPLPTSVKFLKTALQQANLHELEGNEPFL